MTPAHTAILAAALICLLAPFCAKAEEPPCRAEGDRVSCQRDGFKALTDACVQARADAKTCGLRLADAGKDAEALTVELGACRAALAAVPPPPPPPSATRPLVGYGVGVASTVALLTAILAPLPDTARLALGGAGLVGLGGGVVLVLP